MKIVLGEQVKDTKIEWFETDNFYAGEIGVSNETPAKFYFVLDDEMICLHTKELLTNYDNDFKLRRLNKDERLTVTFIGE